MSTSTSECVSLESAKLELHSLGAETLEILTRLSYRDARRRLEAELCVRRHLILANV